jgi:hypothetical protein
MSEIPPEVETLVEKCTCEAVRAARDIHGPLSRREEKLVYDTAYAAFTGSIKSIPELSAALEESVAVQLWWGQPGGKN